MGDPKNPYRQDEEGAGESAPLDFADLYHPEAHGLTGEMLDALMRATFTEGVQLGRQRTAEALEHQFAERRASIHDYGFESGVAAHEETLGVMRSDLLAVGRIVEGSQMSRRKKATIQSFIERCLDRIGERIEP